MGRFGMHWDQFLDANDVDLRYIAGPSYVGPPLRQFSDGTREDIWGVRRQTVVVHTPHGTESYEELAVAPLAAALSAEQVEAYDHWPSPDWFDYGPIEEQCRQIRSQRRVVVFEGDRLNRVAQLKPAMYLRGIALILEDMALRPDLALAVFGHIRSFYRGYLQRILSASRGSLDIVLTGDDYGAQNGPLVSPRMWVSLLGPGFAEYVGLIKSYGAVAMHHTCGSVRPLIPLMVERGLDVLQSLQPEAHGMQARDLKAEFGRRLAFHGGISVQRTLPYGTVEEVQQEVHERAEVLGRGGGYILCTSHNIQADTPLDNIIALLDAYRTHSRYA